jgi:hypothetical protein
MNPNPCLEEQMSNYIATLTVALVSALGIGLQAQDSIVTTKTKVKGDDAKTVTYTGCMQSGPEARTYILDKVVPLSRTTTTETTGTSGTTTTTSTTTYALVPDERVELEQHVGHKVEVTGMMMPAGKSKTETKTKVEREQSGETTRTETTKTNGSRSVPQFRVISVKYLAGSCS